MLGESPSVDEEEADPGEDHGHAKSEADDQHKAPLVHDDFPQGIRQSQLFERRNFRRDRPNDHPDLLLLDKDIYAEAAKSWNGYREIALEVPREFFTLPLVHRRVREHSRDVAGEFLRC